MAALSPTGVARGVGVLLGVGVAASLLIASRPSANVARLPAIVSFTIAGSGELEVTPRPARPLMIARSLTAGGAPASATFTVRNQTARTLTVAFGARGGGRELDGLLRIRMDAGHRTLADSTLQGLRHASARTLRLRSGATRAITLTAWIPAQTNDYEGRNVAIRLTATPRRAA